MQKFDIFSTWTNCWKKSVDLVGIWDGMQLMWPHSNVCIMKLLFVNIIFPIYFDQCLLQNRGKITVCLKDTSSIELPLRNWYFITQIHGIFFHSSMNGTQCCQFEFLLPSRHWQSGVLSQFIIDSCLQSTINVIDVSAESPNFDFCC